jgi:hypothetical protein
MIHGELLMKNESAGGRSRRAANPALFLATGRRSPAAIVIRVKLPIKCANSIKGIGFVLDIDVCGRGNTRSLKSICFRLEQTTVVTIS